MELQDRIEELEEKIKDLEDVIADAQGSLENRLYELEDLKAKQSREWEQEDREQALEYSRSRF